VTGRGAFAKVNAFAKMAAEYDPANPDENVVYYQVKLAELYEKFRIFVDRPGLFVPPSEDEGKPAQLSMFDIPPVKSEELAKSEDLEVDAEEPVIEPEE
jgi:hypothetical protein